MCHFVISWPLGPFFYSYKGIFGRFSFLVIGSVGNELTNWAQFFRDQVDRLRDFWLAKQRAKNEPSSCSIVDTIEKTRRKTIPKMIATIPSTSINSEHHWPLSFIQRSITAPPICAPKPSAKKEALIICPISSSLNIFFSFLFRDNSRGSRNLARD